MFKWSFHDSMDWMFKAREYFGRPSDSRSEDLFLDNYRKLQMAFDGVFFMTKAHLSSQCFF
jgi:hypothetical protein